MRTTLDIADDVLFAAKELARRDKKSVGQVISELARRAFASPATAPEGAPRGGIVSNELIDRLRDEEGV